MQKQVQELIDHIWGLAKQSLDHQEVALYDTLTEFARRLAVDARSETRGQPGGSQPNQHRTYQILADFRGQHCEAQLDAAKIISTRAACVLSEGSWKTASRAAMDLFPNLKAINGWRWWKYTRDDGSLGFIDEIRDSMNVGRVERQV